VDVDESQSESETFEMEVQVGHGGYKVVAQIRRYMGGMSPESNLQMYFKGWSDFVRGDTNDVMNRGRKIKLQVSYY
jgi:hypothetical protein